MKTIALSQGMEAMVDDEDFEWLSQWKWCARKSHNTFYASRNIHLPNGKQITILMHRAIMERAGHNLAGLMVDHREHDGLDNRKLNLRIVTNAQNIANRSGLQFGNSSGYLGVDFHKQKQLWRARIQVNGRSKHIGRFDTAELAAEARDKYIIDNGLTFHTLSFPVAA